MRDSNSFAAIRTAVDSLFQNCFTAQMECPTLRASNRDRDSTAVTGRGCPGQSRSRVYDQQIGRKLAESRQSFFAPTGGGRGNAMVTKDDVRPYLIPCQSTWAASREIVQTIWLPLLMMATFAAFFFAIGYMAFLRMDVRVW